MAATLLQEISQNADERARLRSRKMYEMDQLSNLDASEIKGRVEGRAEIIALLKKGISLEEIEKMF